MADFASGDSGIITVSKVGYNGADRGTTTDEELVDSMLADQYGYYAFANVIAGYQYVVRATRVDQQTTTV